MSQPSSPRLSALIHACAATLLRHRRTLLWLFLLATVALGFSATRVRLDPGFAKTVPLRHPYMQTYTEFARQFAGANRIQVSLRWRGDGDIYNAPFLAALREATDDVFFVPGVVRSRVASLFTPNVRYTEVTEAGFYGDVVVPARFSGQPDELALVRTNVARSGQIGQLVSNDLKSAMVQAELLETDPATGRKLDYVDVARRLEQLRAKYAARNIDVHITGFSKVIGDVMDGIDGVLGFFGVAFAVTALLLLLYTRSLRMSVLALAVALMPVVWLLGILPLIGYGIDPMSILVPFLIFSIGVSHAVQMTNAWRQAVHAGTDGRGAAADAFRALFVPGTLALLTNALGFLVIMTIDIAIVRELGVTACIGVLLMILTNKVFLPVLLSYCGERAAGPAPAKGAARSAFWWTMSSAASPRVAPWVMLVSAMLLVAGAYGARLLHIGDIGSGAPELRADSRYNRDHAAIGSQYNVGSDVLSIIAVAGGDAESGDACLRYPVMSAIERFEIHMRGVAGVRSVVSVPSLAKVTIGAYNEGSPRWQALPRTGAGLQQGARSFNPDDGMNTENCKAIQVLIYTDNHEGATIAHVVSEVKAFIASGNAQPVQLRLASGDVGVMAATNEAVEQAEVGMLLAIFGAITVLCLLTFRSWQAVLCIIVPLALVSVLCNALMPLLGIGLKVSTLPVVALGVGVGVDYGIYLYERIAHQMRAEGQDFRMAFYEAMRQRGTAALFTAVTMSLGVATWTFSALKFQADMGVLLAFMFLVNVLGSIFLLPALAAGLLSGRGAAAPAPPVPPGARIDAESGAGADPEPDVIVVGSGGGAMLAAIRAADNGLSVLVVEKCSQFGGTTAISGGGIWIPNNHLGEQAGAKDSFDEALAYVHACVAPHFDESRVRAYLQAGPRLVRYLHERTRVRFTALPHYADYFQHKPCAKPGFRSLDPAPFDAAQLGDDFALQRPPLGATLIGGRLSMTQTEARLILGKHAGWILKLLKIVLRYVFDVPWRMRHGADRRLTLGAALVAGLRASLRDRGVPLWLDTPLTSLIYEDGKVTGVVVQRGGKPLPLRARRGVILAAGGFEWNQRMREQYLPQPTRAEWSVTPPHANTGDAIRAGQAVGAKLDLMGYMWGVPAVQVPGMPHTHPIFVERSLPGCVIVDAAGQRFANENLAYSELVQTMYARAAQGHASAVPAWIVFDGRFRKQYPCGPILPGSVMPDNRLPPALKDVLHKADTLDALAERIGVDAAGLKATVENMNRYAANGVDEEFGKGDNAFDTYYGDINIKPNPCLAPLAQGPFYAIRLVPGDIGTKGGMATDVHARVLGQDGEAIPGLYAIGNCSAAVMGTTYPGAGSTIGPAMVFGMLAADHLAGMTEMAGRPVDLAEAS
ncbi:efflux RND transporter permease subunit [Pseudoduganella rivuli]|uniref:efflux RND transporter permease subunit n=1 Tax=Pseudoduganella rivuli TaxID=2666085 RepID=UPI0018A1CAF8|nr:efflux RND transporter permease subunit [Pseudoduganella rivuli]